MQNNTMWALAALVGACAVGCNAGGGGSRARTTPGTGGSGSNPDGHPGGGTLNIGMPNLGNVMPGGTDVVDPDPSNPNIAHPKCTAGTCTDFSPDPIIGEGVPPNVATLFGEPSNFTPGGLCALEPQLSGGGKEGAMLPVNWVRPRFRVAAPAGIDLLEIRLHSPVEKNDLVAYTMY